MHGGNIMSIIMTYSHLVTSGNVLTLMMMTSFGKAASLGAAIAIVIMAAAVAAVLLVNRFHRLSSSSSSLSSSTELSSLFWSYKQYNLSLNETWLQNVILTQVLKLKGLSESGLIDYASKVAHTVTVTTFNSNWDCSHIIPPTLVAKIICERPPLSISITTIFIYIFYFHDFEYCH